MMIKKDAIKYAAGLARISLTGQEEELFAAQLNDILAYMEQLNKLDTENIEPMSHAVSMGNILREDMVKSPLSNDDALKNAPEKEKGFFRVPKIIE
jgi:aspartyl-tRNA(Asn)/glutamyl-tRNA(Gln) amidotransferase subunit C